MVDAPGYDFYVNLHSVLLLTLVGANNGVVGVYCISYRRGVSKLFVLTRWAISGPQDVERVTGTDPTLLFI